MKISVDVDCTPEEARRLMGLPDLSPVHDVFLDKIKEMMSSGVSPEMVDQMVRGWAPMGEAGFNAWRQLFTGMTRPGAE